MVGCCPPCGATVKSRVVVDEGWVTT